MSTNPFASAVPGFKFENIFAPVRSAFGETAAVEPGEPSFALLRSGPPVPDDEVETHAEAIEIRVSWGAQVLSVAHIGRGKGYGVGEGSDLVLPEDVIGHGRLSLIESRGDAMVARLPEGARGTIERSGQVAQVAGPNEIVLAEGMKLRFELGHVRGDGAVGEPFTFEVAAVREGKTAPVPFMASLASTANKFIALSFFGHVAVVATLAMFMPKMSNDDSDAIDRDQLMLMQKLLNASAEKALDAPEPTPGPTEENAGGGSTGAPHKGESGAAGTTKMVTTDGRMAFKGKDQESAIGKREERKMAETFGLVGIVMANSDPNAPTTPWGETHQGVDDVSKFGKMYGSSIDDAAGFGVGLSGAGEGGGGDANVLGLDRVNTIGGGGGGKGKWGIGPGDRDGIGIGSGPGKGGHVAKAPKMWNPTDISTNGRLPPEVIQRIVRQNFGRFRLCYEAGLRSNPSLSGRVATQFVIGRDGAVSIARDAGSDMPDQGVVRCVVQSFHALSFPTPEGGIATVTYPIAFSPGE